MEQKKRDQQIVEKIIKHCINIRAARDRYGDSYEQFAADIDYFDVVCMRLLQIGEIANHFSDEFLEQHSDMPWRKIVNLRNIAVHGYEQLKPQQLWNIICEDVPRLYQYCLAIQADNGV
ncbi:antitoxin [Campylobacterota bacterium]|nr:antitoxin [Campylobacterota bacterium]